MARLGDVCEKVTDYVASGSFAALKENVLITNEENYAVMVKTADFANGFTKNLTYTDKRGYDFLRNSNLFGGELILSNIGSIGKVFKVPHLNRPMTLASNTVMIKTETPELTDYLYYYFLSPTGYKNLLSISSGTSMLKFNKTELKKLEVPIPSREKQIDIITVLDKVTELIALRKEQLAKLDDLVKSRFIELFGDVANSPKYSGVPLGTICSTLSGGTPTTKIPEYYQGDIPWISTPYLGNNHINGSNAKAYITEDAIKNSATHLIPANTIMFGIRVGVGKSSIIDEPMCANQDIVALMGIDTKKYNLLFVKHVLDAYQSHFDSIKKGATILGITTEDLKKVLVPSVDIDLQNQFTAFVEQTDKSKLAIQESLAELETLKKALMQKYFG